MGQMTAVPHLVIGVDPGLTTGICALKPISGNAGYVTALQIQSDYAPFVMRLVEMLKDELRERDCITILAVEQFVVSNRAARSATPKAGRVTRNIIDLLDVGSGIYTRVVQRRATDVKPWATDAVLDAAGLLAPTKGMPHARDAARHALFAAVHSGLIPHPLSKKASSS